MKTKNDINTNWHDTFNFEKGRHETWGKERKKSREKKNNSSKPYR
jgi:hypothetical protein